MVRTADREFICPYVSAKFRELADLGPHEEFKAQHFIDKIFPEDLVEYQEKLRISRRELSSWDSEFRLETPTGEIEWFRIQAVAEAGENGSTIWHGQMMNINERKKAEEHVHRLAYFDPVTSLSNRLGFFSQVKEYLCEAETKNGHAALCFIDLDNFKFLNDSHGHSFGDKLLRKVADRLSETLEAINTPQPFGGAHVSRFGGDEFVLLLKDLDADPDIAGETALEVGNILLSAVRRGFVIDGTDCPMTMSMGVVKFKLSDDNELDDLLKSADIAMYEAKKGGRDSLVTFDTDTHRSVSDTYSLQRDIQLAIRQDQFVLEFQPQIGRNGKISSAEVLARWNHPVRGRIMPDEFIGLAEQTGQISQLNEWVSNQSIRTLSEWQEDDTLRDIALTVNISPRQMLDTNFAPLIEKLLGDHNIKPDLLMIELTEHVMARNPECVEACMHRLKKSGVRFSLDDFGTGYSSISQLRRFPFDELKIDGSFVAEIDEQDEVRELVTAILNMANALGLKTVAEHVTSIEQAELLLSLGCDFMQGYLFSPALPMKEFLALIRAHQSKHKPLADSSQTG